MLLLALLAAAAALAPLPAAAQSPAAAQQWLHAVLHHRPGEIDDALRSVADMPTERFTTRAGDLDAILQSEFRTPAVRNGVRYRAALLHTDIALLLPDAAATLTAEEATAALTERPAFGSTMPPRRPRESLVYASDGEYLTQGTLSGHWVLASWLLARVKPDAASDGFVRLWYRGVAATFLSKYEFGSAMHHLTRAKAVLPRDPVLLLYSGALHAALAAPGFQNVYATQPLTPFDPRTGRFTALRPAAEHTAQVLLRTAELDLRNALKYGAAAEAAIRLGYVTARQGRHREAVKILAATDPPDENPALAYFHALFLGTEYGALGQIDDARAMLERAASLSPTAQTPLVAMGHALRHAGDRTAALEVLRRLAALPSDLAHRTDPWLDYHRSYAADAEEQLAAVRAAAARPL